MLKIGVMVSGGGTNLQAIIDAIETGKITNTEIRVVLSNNQNAYALERARKAGIEAVCLSPQDFRGIRPGSDCPGRISGNYSGRYD